MKADNSNQADQAVWTDSLLEQLGELDHLYRTAPVGLCSFDQDLRYLRINKRLAEINGRPVSAHVGHTVRELLPELALTLEPMLRQVIATGEAMLNHEVHGTTPAEPGVERYWLNNCYPLFSADGKVQGISVVVQEITELKRAEEALREAHDQLERRIEERTEELTEAVALLRQENAERKKAPFPCPGTEYPAPRPAACSRETRIRRASRAGA